MMYEIMEVFKKAGLSSVTNLTDPYKWDTCLFLNILPLISGTQLVDHLFH